MTHPIERTIRYAQYQSLAFDCDLLLWRPRSWYGHIIARATDGPYSHISAVLHWEGSLWQVGYEESKGGYGSPLQVAVQRWPGCIDVLRVTVEFDKKIVSESLRTRLGWDYKWSYIRTMAMLHAPFVRWVDWSRKAMQNAERKTAGGVCSSHVASAFAESRIQFQTDIEPSQINPNHIYRSAITHTIGTLV